MADPQFCALGVDHWAACMTKAEWAAWVQSAGSIIALGIAVALPWWTGRSNERQAERAAMIFGHRLYLVLLAIEQGCKTQQDHVLKRQSFVLEEVVALGRAVPLDRLAPAELNPHSKLRGIAAEALHESRSIGDAVAINYQHLEHAFKSYSERVVKIMAGDDELESWLNPPSAQS